MNISDFHAELKKRETPVVVDFWAPWCGPCRAIDPILKKLADEFNGKVDLWKINADEHPDLLIEMKIYGIPTIMAFRDGREFARKTGVQPAKYYFDLFQALATGGAAPVKSLAPLDRWLRLAAGGILLWLGYSQANWIMLAIAAVILFSAVYDRCPLWKAITARLSKRA